MVDGGRWTVDDSMQMADGSMRTASANKNPAEEFMQYFGVSLPSDMKRLGTSYYSPSKDVLQLQQRIAQEPVFLGSRLGKEIKGVFMPSVELLQEATQTTDKKIVVNEKAAWLFVCGRDIFAENVLSAVGSRQSADGGRWTVDDRRIAIKQGDYVLILNEQEECLGYGLVKTLRDGKPSVKNVYDVGMDLR